MSSIRQLKYVLAGLVLATSLQTRGDLIGYWPLDAASGGIATNLAPGGVNGVLTNGAAWTTDGQRGHVISFDGSDDLIIAGSIPALGIYSNFTWSFWTYNKQSANNNVILGNRWSADSMTGSQWIKFTPSKFEYSGSFIDYVDVPQNEWVHHAAVKYRNTLTYYRNGVLFTNVTVTTDLISFPLYMGGDKFSEHWQGLMDDVAIWTDALPSNSIAGLADGIYTPLTAPPYPDIFDLADALGGGDGRLPGFGGAGNLSATMGTYTPFPANPYVDGTFVPNTNDTACVIDSAGHVYDFNPQNSSSINMAWYNGVSLDTDPSTNIVADFSGDPNNHSLISGHASKGITFDLTAVREKTERSIEKFTAYIGDSRPKAGGSISYYVFVDGVLVTNRFNMTDDEDFVTVTQVSKGHYLSIAITDANDGATCDHGYLGDPFLTLISPTNTASLVGTAILIH